MIKIDDLVSLAKAGWTPHQVKEVLEMLETSPKVKEAAPEDLKEPESIKEPEPQPEEKKPEDTDPIEDLKKLLTED